MYMSFTVDVKQLNIGVGSHKSIHKVLFRGASCSAQANVVVKDKKEYPEMWHCVYKYPIWNCGVL